MGSMRQRDAGTKMGKTALELIAEQDALRGRRARAEAEVATLITGERELSAALQGSGGDTASADAARNKWLAYRTEMKARLAKLDTEFASIDQAEQRVHSDLLNLQREAEKALHDGANPELDRTRPPPTSKP